MRLRLESDFSDSYDVWFDREGEVFRRVSTDGMNRREMLAYLSNRGYGVPLHGRVSDLCDELGEDRRVVVYTDIHAHSGEGKVLCTAHEALEFHFGAYCSVYVEPDGSDGDSRSAVSARLLQIGRRSWWLEYRSTEDWRSNVGEGFIHVHRERKPGYHPQIRVPLFAIDFVPRLPDWDDPRPTYAIDFNIAPGMKGTGMQDVLLGREAVDLIKEAVAHFREEEG